MSANEPTNSKVQKGKGNQSFVSTSACFLSSTGQVGNRSLLRVSTPVDKTSEYYTLLYHATAGVTCLQPRKVSGVRQSPRSPTLPQRVSRPLTPVDRQTKISAATKADDPKTTLQTSWQDPGNTQFSGQGVSFNILSQICALAPNHKNNTHS